MHEVRADGNFYLHAILFLFFLFLKLSNSDPLNSSPSAVKKKRSQRLRTLLFTVCMPKQQNVIIPVILMAAKPSYLFLSIVAVASV